MWEKAKAAGRIIKKVLNIAWLTLGCIFLLASIILTLWPTEPYSPLTPKDKIPPYLDPIPIKITDSFDAVHIGTRAYVIIETGQTPGVMVYGPRSLSHDNMEISMDNGTLSIMPANEAPPCYTRGRGRGSCRVVIVVKMPALHTLIVSSNATVLAKTLTGETAKVRLYDFSTLKILEVDADTVDLVHDSAGEVKVMQAFRAKRAIVSVRGSGYLKLPMMDVDTFTLTHNGEKTTRLGGRCKQGTFIVAGSGDVTGHKLRCQALALNSSGKGDLVLGESSTAHIVHTGPGKVKLDGHPRCIVQKTGLGKVQCGKKKSAKRKQWPATSSAGL